MSGSVPAELVDVFAHALEQLDYCRATRTQHGTLYMPLFDGTAGAAAAELLLKVQEITSGVGNEASNAHASDGWGKPRSMAGSHAGKLGSRCEGTGEGRA